MEIIDFKTRESILAEGVTDENAMTIEVDGKEIENADEVLVITNDVDGNVSIHTNMDLRAIIYMLEFIKFDLLTRSDE